MKTATIMTKIISRCCVKGIFADNTFLLYRLSAHIILSNLKLVAGYACFSEKGLFSIMYLY